MLHKEPRKLIKNHSYIMGYIGFQCDVGAASSVNVVRGLLKEMDIGGHGCSILEKREALKRELEKNIVK